MMGHTNIRSTQHYARIVDKKIADEMMAMSERVNLPLAQWLHGFVQVQIHNHPH